ncbi:MAG TPA: hypothetical protein PLB76_12750 [Anaerohalosphaeraceae bacterium]|nr:hypothetical protein [Anaerohalosphaeraceae bacterium]
MALSGSSEGFEGITADGNAFSAEMEKQFGSIYDITMPVFLADCNNPRAVFQAKSYDVVYNRDVAIADPGQYYHSSSITLSPYTRYYLMVQINGKWCARFANVWGNAVYGFLSGISDLFPPFEVLWECLERPELSFPHFRRGGGNHYVEVPDGARLNWRVKIKCRAGKPNEYITDWSNWHQQND